MQLNKDGRNVGVSASTYGENALIEPAQKKLPNGIGSSENEVELYNISIKAINIISKYLPKF